MSAADLVAVLVARHLRVDWDDPSSPGNDHLTFSKGHASPLLYSVFKAVGVVAEDELLGGYRRFGQRLQGHPTPVLPWVDVATGSLGQGLPDGVGIALAGKHLERQPYRVWVLCGDSELAEGSSWEALDKAAYYRLANLVAIVDINRLGQRGPTELGWNLDAYARRAEAFGAAAAEFFQPAEDPASGQGQRDDRGRAQPKLMLVDLSAIGWLRPITALGRRRDPSHPPPSWRPCSRLRGWCRLPGSASMTSVPSGWSGPWSPLAASGHRRIPAGGARRWALASTTCHARGANL